MHHIPVLASVAGLAPTSDGWIVDIWGVMHNGIAPHARAVDACRRFRASGGVVLLVSNAPRPNTAVMAQLDGIGVPRDAYTAILSSGDVTRDMIVPWQGKPLFHLGPARDKGLFEGFDIRFADAQTCAVVICSGLLDDTKDTPETYRPVLETLRARAVPMICANPDIRVERGEKLVYCAGAVAQLYGEMGGAVTYAGKPWPPIYDRAVREIGRLAGRDVPRARILAIGDGLETDIKGAGAAGIRSVFIASAIHVEAALDDAELDRLFAGRPHPPVAALDTLAW